MITSNSWDAVIPSDESTDLYTALRPKAEAAIILRGGLKMTDSNAWLEGFPPIVRVYGFAKEFELTVTTEKKEILSQIIQAQQDVFLPKELEPGYYLININWHGQPLSRRTLVIENWQELQPYKRDINVVTRLRGDAGDIQIQGAVIKKTLKSDYC
jgi:hypothetical protein